MSSEQSTHDFIRHLLSATASATLYGMAHPQVSRLSSLAFTAISIMLESRPDVTILVVENELIINGNPQDLSLLFTRFTQILKSREISTLKLLSGTSKPDIDELIGRLAGQQDDSAASADFSKHIRVGKIDLRASGATGDADISGRKNNALALPDLPHEELAHFMDIYEAVKNKKKLQIKGVYNIVSGFINVFRKEGKPLLAMAALRDSDEYTFTHSTNVCVLNLAQAMALGIEGPLLNDIGVAAMLHDIGKLFIPEEILSKPGKLTAEEFDIIRQHPVKGARYLLDTTGVPRLAVIVAYEHHLKFNLSGYPNVSQNWQQNICSHMTTISDFFDALRTRRSYREPMHMREIAGIMLDMMGTELHPTLARNFLRILSGLVETDNRTVV